MDRATFDALSAEVLAEGAYLTAGRVGVGGLLVAGVNACYHK